MSELQLELETVIDHKRSHCYWCFGTGIVQPEQGVTLGGYRCTQCDERYPAQEDTHKPAGVRLAKMLGQYDDSPSSQLWSEIQSLAREILG